MSITSKVIVFGAPHTGRHALINGLSHLNQFYLDKIHEQTYQDVVFHIYPYKLRNKYFTAEIDLFVCYDESVIYTKDLLEEIGLLGCQAVLYVFDMTRMETYSQCTQLHQDLSSYFKNVDCQLLIGSHRDYINDEQYEQVRSEVVNWCIDNAFEFIPANLLEPYHTHEEREKEGIARVSECLDCVMWENMERISGEVELPSKDSIIPIQKIEKKKQVICNYCKKIQEDIPFKMCSRCRNVLYCSKECQIADWKTHKLVCKSPESKKDSEEKKKPIDTALESLNAFNMSPEEAIRSTMTEEEKKQEDDMNEFLKIMMKARQTKLEASSLPDKERKERAARMTIEIMKHLGLTGEEKSLEEELDEIQKDLEKNP